MKTPPDSITYISIHGFVFIKIQIINTFVLALSNIVDHVSYPRAYMIYAACSLGQTASFIDGMTDGC
jgi:hypothetical protein